MTAKYATPTMSEMTHDHPPIHGDRPSSKIVVGLRLVLILLPVLSLIISAWSWLKYGVDIPVYDDWRQYNANDMGRLDLRYLLTPHNDTLYTFGLLLDSLAFRFLDGNTVAYQLMSIITVLGGILILQWRLLGLCTQDNTIRAISFSLTLLMLQPDTYWGWQNLAYHQAVPLICLLGVLALTLRSGSVSLLVCAGAALLVLISGLTYISGAFSALALCATFMILAALKKTNYSSNLLRVGVATAVPALATTAAQLWVIVEIQHGTHRADAPMAFPWESDFWYFMLGKIGRSLMLPMSHPTLSLTLTVAATLLIISIVTVGFIKLSRDTAINTQRTLIVTLSLAAIVFVYLLLISAGRTNLRPESVTSARDIFVYGFYRFHFFWVTLLWPWVAIVCIKFLRTRYTSNSFMILLASVSVACWLAAIASTPILDNYNFFKTTMKQRSEGITCLLAKIQSPGAVICPNIDLGDIAEGIKHGRAAHASFARTLPILPIALGTNSPPPLFRLSEQLNGIRINNATTNAGANTLNLNTKNDPSVIVTIPGSTDLARCETLDVVISMQASDPSVAQIFYMTPKHIGYSEDYSVTTSVSSSASPELLTMTINSSDGFVNELRFDPVTAAQNIKINELEIRCRATINSN
jgi:hypothetical protein